MLMFHDKGFFFYMNVRLRVYKYCYSKIGTIYAKGLLKKDWIPHWDLHAQYFNFRNLIFYFLCTSQGPCTCFGDEFVVHCFGLHASHMGKIHARINKKQFNSACKLHSWTLQDPYVQILLKQTMKQTMFAIFHKI